MLVYLLYSSQIHALFLGNGKYKSALNFERNPNNVIGSIHTDIGFLVIEDMKENAVSIESKEYKRYKREKEEGQKYFLVKEQEEQVSSLAEETTGMVDLTEALEDILKMEKLLRKPTVISTGVALRGF